MLAKLTAGSMICRILMSAISNFDNNIRKTGISLGSKLYCAKLPKIIISSPRNSGYGYSKESFGIGVRYR